MGKEAGKRDAKPTRSYWINEQCELAKPDAMVMHLCVASMHPQRANEIGTTEWTFERHPSRIDSFDSRRNRFDVQSIFR